MKTKDKKEELKTYHLCTDKQFWKIRDRLPEETFDTHQQVYNRITELSNQSINPTKKQLKEEFPNYDIEMILDNLIKADAIFAGKILE